MSLPLPAPSGGTRASAEEGFDDLLYRWIERTPWMAVSLALHFLAFLVLAAIPWRELRRPQEVPVVLGFEPKEEPIFEERRDEPEPDQSEPEASLEDPAWFDESDESSDDFEPTDRDAPPGPTLPGPPTDHFDPADPIGPGPGASGPPGGRRGRPTQERHVERALAAALAWLAAHQSPDGSWDADGFAARCGRIGAGRCDGPGGAPHDVGVTALALLAFLGEGTTTLEGEQRDVVRRGAEWLLDVQDRDGGLVGERASADFLYDHALATLALCELLHQTHSPLFRRPAQLAIDYVQAARTPWGGWRYDVPPIGESDTSLTGWMLMALVAGRDAGLAVDERALTGGLAWLDEATDPASGRVGYDGRGSSSSRTPANAHFPPEANETLTAVALFCRFFLGQDPAEVAVMERHADLLARALPRLEDRGRPAVDMYYWYYGTYALFQLGGPRWRSWEDALEEVVLGTQSRDGDERGSWDPAGAWGYAGGRVYATALMALCLEVHFRYARLLGTR